MLGKDQDMTNDHPNAESLQKMLRDYDQQVVTQTEGLQRLRDEEREMDLSIQKLREKERSLTEQKARMEAAREQQQQRCKQRYAKMEGIVQTYSLNMQLSSQNGNVSFDGSFAASQITTLTGCAGSSEDMNPEQNITQDDMENFLKVMDEKEKEIQELYEDGKKKHQAEEDKLIAALSDLEGRRKTVQNGTLCLF